MIICPPWRVLRLPRAEERLRQAGGKGQGFHSQNNANKREEVKPDSRTKGEKNLEEGRKRGRERERRGRRRSSEVNKDEREKKHFNESSSGGWEGQESQYW